MAFNSQTANTTLERGMTVQEIWEEVRSEEQVAEMCQDTGAVPFQSNTRVWAFLHQIVMKEVETKATSNLRVNLK